MAFKVGGGASGSGELVNWVGQPDSDDNSVGAEARAETGALSAAIDFHRLERLRRWPIHLLGRRF